MLQRRASIKLACVALAVAATACVVLYVRTGQRGAEYVPVIDAVGDVARDGLGVSPLGARLHALFEDELAVISDREEALNVIERTLAASLGASWEEVHALARSNGAAPNAGVIAAARDLAGRLPPNHRPEGWPDISVEELLRWRFERATPISHVLLDRAALEVRNTPLQSLDAQQASWRALQGVPPERLGLSTSAGSSFHPPDYGAGEEAARAGDTLLILMRVRAADGAEAALVYEFVHTPRAGWWCVGVWSLTLRPEPGEEADDQPSSVVLPPL